jgi:hypothetical protein
MTNLQAPTPQWSRRKLLTLALTALVVTVALPMLLHLTLLPLLTLPHPLRVTIAALVLAMTLLSALLCLSWLILAAARSVRNL